MLQLSPQTKVHVALAPTDMRRGFAGLSGEVRQVLEQDPLSGHLFVFFSKRLDRVRIAYWDRSGFAMWTKRLERGRFRPRLARDGTFTVAALDVAELALLVEGIELADARRRPRWEPARHDREQGSRTSR